MHAWARVYRELIAPITNRRHAMSTTIFAIDLGKFNSVLCWYDPSTKDTAFRTVRTLVDELRKELTRQAVAHVVFEACSQAGWVHDLCVELQLKPLVASTTGAAWQWKRVKRKTDRDDALTPKCCLVPPRPDREA